MVALSSKEPTCQRRRLKRRGFHPWVGKIPWRRKGQPLQYSCLENPMERGAWRVAEHGVAKSWTRLKRLSTQYFPGCQSVFIYLRVLHMHEHVYACNSQIHMALGQARYPREKVFLPAAGFPRNHDRTRNASPHGSPAIPGMSFQECQECVTGERHRAMQWPVEGSFWAHTDPRPAARRSILKEDAHHGAQGMCWLCAHSWKEFRSGGDPFGGRLASLRSGGAVEVDLSSGRARGEPER